jgi:hypothetical protein
MSELKQLEFFVLRYAPSAVKDEFVNIGVVLFEPGGENESFAEVRFVRDWRHVWCLDPQADIEVLEALQREIRGQLEKKSDREMLIRRIQDSFSNTIQLSPMKACQTAAPAKEIEWLGKMYLERPPQARPKVLSGRDHIVSQMQTEFERAGVWKLLMHGVPVSPYTKPGDTFKFDFGYRVGAAIKLFHAVSLKRSIDAAVMLASRYPVIAGQMAEATKASPLLTAVIDDDLDRSEAGIQFALEMMQEARVTVAPVAEMPRIADAARRELLE